MSSLVGRKGVDISYANGDINLSAVKNAGYEFVMIRCGYGGDQVSQDDSQFHSNVRKANALKMPWGVYLYSYACSISDAKSEIAHITRLLKNNKPSLPVALDVEDTSYYQRHGVYNKSTLTKIVGTILDGIKDAGYYPLLYTGKYWLDGYAGVSGVIDKSVWSKYDIWLASWTSTCTYNGTNLGMWQYGGETNLLESNSISGVGVIDKDKAYKDYPSIIGSGNFSFSSTVIGLTEDGSSTTASIQVNYQDLNPYIVTLTRNTHNLNDKEWQKLKDARVCGALVEAGYLYDAAHREVEYRNPKLRSHIESLQQTKLPWGLYSELRAKNTSEAMKEIEEIQPCVRLYPPELGLWLQCTFTSSVSVNDKILQTYYDELERLGLKNKIGIICTKKQLDDISWEKKWSDHYCLWLVEHVKDTSELETLLTPTFFLSGKGDNANRG